MSAILVFLLSFCISALYTYVAMNLYSLISDLGISKSTKICTSLLWLPILLGVIIVFITIFGLFVIATPFVIIAILIDYWYRKITNKSLLFDGEKVKFEL